MGDSPEAEFAAITGGDARTARAFLDQAGGDLQEAVNAYYANGGAPAAAPAGAAAAAPRAAKKPAARRGGAANVRSLGDLAAEDDDDDEEDGFNDYYAGGEKSGQLVRGAPKDPKGKRPAGGDDDDEEDDEDAVEGLFESARRAGAQEGRPGDLPPAAGGGAGFVAFAGRGRTLAGGDAPPGGAGGSAAAAAAAPPAPQRRAVVIAFYRNGVFTVDGGPPRAVADAANAAFVAALAQGRCPAELDPGDPSVEVAVNLVRREEDYEAPPPPKYTAFAGEGRRLVADGGGGGGGAPAAPPPPPAPAAAAWEGADAGRPRTSVQLRLADGSRLVAEFNLDHTVADVRRFIAAARPDQRGAAFRLATAFPARELADDGATIEAAGLANSVIIQKRA